MRTKSRDIRQWVKILKLRYAGHVSRTVTNRCERKILDWTPYGRKIKNEVGRWYSEIRREAVAKDGKRQNLLGEAGGWGGSPLVISDISMKIELNA